MPAGRAHIWLACAAASLIAAAPAPKAPKPLTQEEQALIAAAAERGALIYAYDQAAWHGTDDMRDKMGGKLTGIGGWVVEGPAPSPRLTMIDADEKEPHAVYVANFADGKLVSSHLIGPTEDRRLAPGARTMVVALRAARQALAREKIGVCKPQPFNTVVIPGAGSSPTLVYFLTPQTSNDAVPLAGHYLVEVASDGRAGPVRKFTNTECLEMPLRDPTGTSAGIGVSDLLHKTPTEIHVFTSLTTGMPLYVVTEPSDRLWVVEGGKVRAVADSP